jgi:hypothetical protein
VVGRLVFWVCLLTSPASAQSPIAVTQPGHEQHQPDTPAFERKTGTPLTCRPASVDHEGAYLCQPKGSPPTLPGRLWRWIFRAGRDPIAVLTAFLFIIGGIQVEISRRTAQRQLQAYVYPEHTSLHDGSRANPPWPPEQIGIPTIINIIKNFGQTPAHEVIHWSGVDVKRVTEEDLLHIPEKLDRKSAAFLAPTGATSRISKFHRILTPNEIIEVSTGVSAIYYFGRIEYRDVYGTRRQTSYRCKYVGVWPPPDGASLTYCDGGNNAD